MRFGTKQSLLAAATGILAVSCVIGPEEAYDAEIEEEGSLDNAITIDTSAVYTIVGIQSNKCVEIRGGSTASSAAAQIATCNGATRQQFRAESMGSGYFRLKNVNSGLCLGTNGGSAADGATIVQSACGTAGSQQFQFVDVATNVQRINVRSSGKALDVMGHATADGTSLLQWPWWNGGNQKFSLRAVGSDSGGSGGTRSAGCGSPTSLASGNRTINVNGTPRQYVLDIPANYDPNRAYRLVFGWHWRGGSANDVVNNGYYGLKALANDSAIFVSPNGIDNGWANPGGRDVAFARAMVDSLKTNLCVDTSRVFSTGWSFGGMMSNAIGCDMPDVFRAIAPMSGALYSGCDQSNTQPIAVWMSHGLSDSVVPISAGRAALDVFVRKNGCSTETSPVGPSACVAYQGCREGYPVHRCEFAGDHQTPSFASSAIWSFFTQF
jgi:polyhydroxybutyrate depolymerase